MQSKKGFVILAILGLLIFPIGVTFGHTIEEAVINLVPSTTAGWSFEGNQQGASLGYSWRPAGDINNDGFDDIVVGIYSFDRPLYTDSGRVLVFYGSATGYDAVDPDWTADGEATSDYFGFSVSGAGDVNGDGFDDVLIGAFGYSDTGKAYLYYGSGTGLAAAPAWTATGTQSSADFARNVAGVGDLNGDGWDDIAVGAYRYDEGETDEGKVFVYYGSAAGLSAAPDWTAESNEAGANLGLYLNGIGDVNGDGYDDLLVSAPFYDDVTFNGGAVFAWYGAEGGLGDPGTPSNADWKAGSDQISVYFGSSLGTPGDVNGDGYSDVVMGTGSYDYNQYDDGIVMLWYGSENGINAGTAGNLDNADWLASSWHGGYAFGSLTGTPADINYDGYADLIIGCLFGTPGVFVYFGSEDGPNLGENGDLTNADWQVTVYSSPGSEFYNAVFGWLAGSPGDANGDGIDDLAVVSRDYQHEVGSSDSGYHEGKIFAYYTNAGTISGTATYTGSLPVTGPIIVSAHLNLTDPPVATAPAINSGETYTVQGLSAGSYYLYAFLDANYSGGGPPDPGEPGGWYDADTDGSPDLVTIAEGEDLTGKDIILIDTGGSISGLVTYTGSLGVTGPIYVTAHPTLTDPPIAFASNLQSGDTYTLQVPSGSYYISAFLDADDSGGGPPDPGEPEGWYDGNGDGTPDLVTVGAGEVITGKNIVLTDLSGSISGVVTYSGSYTATGPIIVAAHLTLSDPPAASAPAINSGETYTIQGLPAGSYYISAFLDADDSGGGPPDPGEPEAWYDANSDGTPDKVTLGAGEIITGKNIAIVDPTGSIRGTVTYSGSLGVSGPIMVSAYLDLAGAPVASAAAINSGESYLIDELGAANYYLSAYLDVNSSGTLDPGEPQAWYDANSDGTPNLVALGVGQNLTGKNIALVDPTGSISGTITYTGSLGFNGQILVLAYLELDEPPFATTNPIANGATYSIENLPANAYYLFAYLDGNNSSTLDPGEMSTYYDSDGDGIPDPVILPVGMEVTGIDIEIGDLHLYLPVILR